MKAAIYSRKSKFTGKGESIQNQIEICKDYANTHFDIEEFIIYEDEGFSGGNIDRPEYQRMINAAKKKEFDILICYRLDRISRNISNFSDIIEILQDKGIAFVSVREKFDTSTPMGRAMMYIASVFAQLERETTAERIRDNMLELAKTGRWLGGITPTGFSSEAVHDELKGKQVKHFRLSPIEEELEIIALLFNKFLELKSLSRLETYCIQNDIKSKNGIDYSRFVLKKLLSNPVYAIADKNLYEYFISNDYEVFATENAFNGINGIMAYNKTSQKKNKSHKLKDISEWIISIGAHKGIISGHKWIAVQDLLMKNRSKSYRMVRNNDTLLSGLLRCENCGSYMRPKYGRIKKNGEKAFYYMCELKERSKRQKCNMKNANGNQLDKLLVDEIKRLSSNKSDLLDKISNDRIILQYSQNSILSEIEIIKATIKNTESSIANLVSTLSQGYDTRAAKHIINQIDDLDRQNVKSKERLHTLKEKAEDNKLSKQNLDVIRNMLETFSEIIDSLDSIEKRNLIRSIVEKLTWDGAYIDVVMFGYNTKKISKNVSTM
ncbi:recombinase family protein [Wukongibacter baidiensis]|uniref:recombinase family protein n=1 Tax=Wukongibacter baidiensis TaxID=1723361 RepID=UPI003D7F652B